MTYEPKAFLNNPVFLRNTGVKHRDEINPDPDKRLVLHRRRPSGVPLSFSIGALARGTFAVFPKEKQMFLRTSQLVPIGAKRDTRTKCFLRKH